MSYRDWTRTALVAIVVLVVAVASGGMGFAFGWYLSPQATPSPSAAANDDIQQRFRIFWEAWDVIERDFNRDGPLDTQKMIYGATSGMVRSLGDPYTVFVEPAQAKIFDQDLEGSFEGIGASVDVIDGHLVIIEPLQDSPALKAGLRAGDIVLEADGKSLQGLDLMQAIALIRGPKGSQVQLLIRRQGVPEPFEVVVTREKIDHPTVAHSMLEDRIAYVRLTEFNNQATARLRAALQELLADEPRALILDLRGNPGGYLHIAVQVASQFIPDGVIVTEKDRNGEITEYTAEGEGLALELPLVVLVDGGSASAAEIVAGAIQDQGRGVLVGRPTFGKGSVQTSHTLSDSSSVRVSIARWYTPDGHQLDSEGLTPEIVVPLDLERQAGEDPVLERAIEYLAAQHLAPGAKT